MNRVVITYGIIAGLITGGLMLATMPLYDKGILNFDNGALVGYTGMVIALSLIFFGVKSFRDNQSKRAITFGKGVWIGVLITCVAAMFYAGAWEITYAKSGDKFMRLWTEHELSKLKAGGASAVDLQKAEAEWEDFQKMYENPIVRFGITLMEIFPVGLAISLISAGLLRKKDFLPDSPKV